MVIVLLVIILLSSAALDCSLPLQPRLLPHQHVSLQYSRESTLCLKDYLLIGTHGSSAYRLDCMSLVDDRGVRMKSLAGKLTPGLIKQWALNQHYDIYSQLALGARYVHLEVAVHDGEWVTIHSFLAGKLSDDLDQITRFLDHTTDGFALVHLQHFGETTRDHTNKTCMDHIHELAPKYHCSDPVTRATPLRALTGKLVVLGGDGLQIELYPGDYTGDVATFDSNRTTHRIQMHPPSQLNHPKTLLGFQWVLTPGTHEIAVDAVDPFHQSGLFDRVTVTSKTRLRDYLATHPDMFHVFIVDHFDEETRICIEEYNTRRLRLS